MRLALAGAAALAAMVVGLGAAGCAGRPEIRYLPRGGSRAAGLFEAGPVLEAERAELRGDGRGALPRGEVDAGRAAKLFAVRVEPAPGAPRAETELPAVAGTYRLTGDTLSFEPRFPLAPGVRYVAVYRPGTAAAVIHQVAVAARDMTPVTSVEALYPSASVWPENLLRFYIVFSAPMSRGQAWSHLRLLRGTGEVVKLPFLELDEELWDPGFRRLTVLIDPGRIKRGLLPLEEVGPALEPETAYVLEVDPGWEDAQGRPLKAPYRKAFRTGPADREPLDPSAWAITAPAAGTREPLAAALGKPLDHGLLHSAVGVEGPGGEAIEGETRVGDFESTWSFTPARPWSDGEHHIVVATTLEDLSGNGVGRPFDVDVLEPIRRRLEVGFVKVAFRPRGGSGASAPPPPPAGNGR